MQHKKTVRFEETPTDDGTRASSASSPSSVEDEQYQEEIGSRRSNAIAGHQHSATPPLFPPSDEALVIPLSQDHNATPDHHQRHSMALALVEAQTADSSAARKSSSKSHDRDVALAEVENEKRNSFIKAWEESEKTKAENKAQKKLATIESWENSKKASLEAELRKIEEKLEKKKAEYGEKMKNKIARYHKDAEEKRAMVEAQRNEELLKAEESAAKYRATGQVPKKFLWCFSP